MCARLDRFFALQPSQLRSGTFSALVPVFDAQVGNPLRDAGVGIKDTSSLLEALVPGFVKACAKCGPQDAGEAEMVDAWRRWGELL